MHKIDYLEEYKDMVTRKCMQMSKKNHLIKTLTFSAKTEIGFFVWLLKPGSAQ